jgi:hypothetical protein
MTRARIVVALVAALLVGVAAQAAGPMLDGRTFTGSMIEQAKEKPLPDTFEFKNGKFHSSACDKYGFGAAAYNIQPDGSFQATTVSPKEGSIQWQGRVTDNTLDGTALWMRPGQAPVHYTIHGTLKH